MARDHISFTWVINQETNKLCVKRLLALSIYHGNEPNEALYTQRTKECFCSWPWFVNGSWAVSFRDTKWKTRVRGRQSLSYSGWKQRPLGSSQRQQTFHLSWKGGIYGLKSPGPVFTKHFILPLKVLLNSSKSFKLRVFS